jgi:hypothetical protein
VPLRIGFDLDGVLADMDAALARHAETLFGESVRRRARETPAPASPAAAADTPPAADCDPAEDSVAYTLTQTFPVELSARQQSRLWHHVQGIENFWETLDECEPGIVARLAALTSDRHWELIFLTRRPETAGATAQVQSQRWLEAHGFTLPSVFVVHGSRGRIAAALGLDSVVDDRPENCLDVVTDSKARAVLVWRADQKFVPAAAKRLGIGVVATVAECLDILTQIDTRPPERPGVVDRVMRLFGLKEPAGV